MRLFKFQKEAIKFIETPRYPVQPYYAIIGDECGLGKTIDVITEAYIHLHEGSFLIICTASMKLKWAREIKIWANKNAHVIYGNKPYKLPKAKFYIINYHILGKENQIDRIKENQHKKEFKKNELIREKECKKNKEVFKKIKYRPYEIRLEGWIDELSKMNIIGIFPDECHRLANDDAIWTRCFIQLFNKIKPKIFVPLSGTLTRKRTKNLFTILNLTAPMLFPNKYRFLFKFCDPTKDTYGWKFDGSSNTKLLNKLLKKVMIRRLKKDVTDLPPRIFSVIPMELTKLELKNYSLLDKEFRRLINIKANKLDIKNTHSELKRLAYLAKRNSVMNWINEYLEDNNKLVIGAWHKSVVNDLYNAFKSISVKIDGSINSKKRLEIEDKFQNDDSIKLIILQIDAGGEGLTLTSSNALAIIECPDTPGQVIQLSDRVHRLTQKSDNVTIYYLFADGTIENKIADDIENYYKSMEEILDGEEKSDGLFKYNFK